MTIARRTIDIIHLVAISEFVYHYVITNWGEHQGIVFRRGQPVHLVLFPRQGNMAIIGESTWTLGLEVMLNTWITFIVQSTCRLLPCVSARSDAMV